MSMTVKEVFANYILWRDVRIPTIEMDLESNQVLTRRYSSIDREIRGTDISDPTTQEVVRREKLQMELATLKRYVFIVESVQRYFENLDPIYNKVFEYLFYPKKHTWVEMAYFSGFTASEFRRKRGKVLDYTSKVLNDGELESA